MKWQNSEGDNYMFAVGVTDLTPILVLGLVPATIAWKWKGRDFFRWWGYGILLFPVALIHACFASKTDKKILESGMHKECPFCKEIVKLDAVVCKYCGKDISNS